MARAPARDPGKAEAARPISLALQGGGAHGAFQWGVVDKLLEDGRLEVKAITGASAGAMNAVVIAAGLLAGGPSGARQKLEAFWRGVASGGGVFGDLGVWSALFNPNWLKAMPGWRFTQGFAGNVSPYDFNPFDLNPLRDILTAQVDFEALRKASPVALYVSATAVATGRARIFRTAEIACEQVMASACLPYLFQAVEIDGEAYWDGGFLANPALWPMFYDPTPDDILIVNLNPFVRRKVPHAPGEILDRINEITFNASLSAELRAIAFVQKLLDEDMLTPAARKAYRRMLVHSIGADRWLQDLDADSKFNTDWGFLTDLKDRGRRAATAWLAKGLDDVGVRSSADLRAEFL
jgi:NTE family protein